MKILNFTASMMLLVVVPSAEAHATKPVTVTLVPQEIEGQRILTVEQKGASALFDFLGTSKQIGGAGEAVERSGSVHCSVAPVPGVGLDYQCYIVPNLDVK